jgi:NAD-dependent dihydropyrimidine dehydrogenase PreA subunit
MKSKDPRALRVIFSFVCVIVAVVALSTVSMRLWGGKAEILPADRQLTIAGTMTIQEFGAANTLSKDALKQVFSTSSSSDAGKKLADTGLSLAEIADRTKKALALANEEASKNWVKIAVKFGAWAVFLVAAVLLLKKRKISPAVRKGLLAAAVLLFGVILGSDPSPMGTVKDAIVLFAKTGAVFMPRLVAFLLMLVGGTILANKVLCSWACQFGTLQDLIFRLNRNAADTKGIFPQIRVPFVVSNAVRIGFLAALIIGAFFWATDIVEGFDPFKIFNPAVLTIAGISVIALILLSSLFVYRPWCHFLCPFGLAGWLGEKISIQKIQVDYSTCVACNACANACPSSVMEAILKREKVVPDCFACGTCIEVCPTKSIDFKSGKRSLPPEGKFRV